jgi:hypothetical protein
MPGTTIENHIACTETSALAGGSQPTPARMRHKRGMGMLTNMLDARTSPPITALVTISLRSIMAVEIVSVSRVVAHNTGTGTPARWFAVYWRIN